MGEGATPSGCDQERNFDRRILESRIQLEFLGTHFPQPSTLRNREEGDGNPRTLKYRSDPIEGIGENEG